MSEIQDLLNASTQDMVDDYLIIDDNSREIYVPSGELLFGVTNDEKTERKYFQCPRIVGDNVDLTQYQLYINYQNANGEKDKYIVTDVKVVDDNIIFTWLLSRKVTEYQGNISFIVCARNVDSLGNITNEWNTAIATGTCVVGLEVDDLTPGEQEQARDYFLQLEQELSALAETENNRLLTTSSNQITNITNKGSEQVQLVENTAKKALDSIPSTYTDLQKQVNEVEDRELKDANGITQELTITDGYAQLTDTATKRLDSLVIKGNTVQNSTKGLNLLKLNNDTITSNGVTSTCLNNVIKFSGTLTSSWANLSTDTRKFLLNKDVQYIFSIDKALNMPCSLQLYYKDKTAQDVTIYKNKLFSDSFMIKDDLVHIRVFVTGRSGTVVNSEIKIMINEGTTAKPYEPYTGGKPSPNPEYPQEVKGVDKIEGKVVGKNLFDISKINSNSNTTSTATINSVIDGVINTQWNTSYQSADIGSNNSSSGWTNTSNNSIKLQPNTYTLSFKHKVIKKLTTIDNLRDFFIRILNKTNNSIITDVQFTGDFANFKNISNTFTLNEATSIYLLVSCNNCQIEIKDIQLEIGSTATPYQPYVEQSISYTLQNPLYKLSNTVYDYIDLDKGKIIRNVGIVEFDGSSDENWVIYGNNTNMNGYSINYKNISGDTPCVCDKLLTTDSISTTLEEAIKVLDNAMYVILNKIRGLNTTELFKSWLQSNPITVYYQLSTPTEEDIPTELLTQLKQLQTYSGETNISFEASDVYPTIDLEYIKDTKKYIESKEELDNQSIIDIDYRVTCLELDMEEQ